ncbi:MAG: endonuclease domain-containing protein [Candidatus Competibacter sp.]|nr:endonuclease domain-containing protein [Candidatus Competibacter sp.]
MTVLFNRASEKQKRQLLRNQSPPAEQRLWFRLRNRQLLGYRFRRQYGIGRYVLDFYCPQIRLAIEIDGDSHFQPGAPEYDRQRQDYIESLGIHFLRFTNTDVFQHLDEVVARIAEVAEGFSAGLTPSKSPPS